MSDSVGSVSVDVVPDARGWSEKLRAQIRDQKVTINADADTGEAEAQLDEVARTRTAKVKTDVSQISQGASKLDQFIGQLGALPALAIAGGAALVPLGAAVAGVTAALAAPLLIAGGGATLFGFLAGFAVKNTQQQLKDIDKLRIKLGGLTKGTQEYRDAQQQLHDAQSALSPAQVQFAGALDGVKTAFDGLLAGKNGQALLGPLTQGLHLLATVLPGLAPLIQGVSGGISSLLGDLSDAAKGPGFTRFIHELAHRVGPDIESFGHIAGNGIRGLTGFILALDHSLSGGVLRGLERLSGRFADLGDNAGKSKALQDFVDYFHRIGPQVADTLGSLATSIGHIVKALAPLGPPTLRIIQGIADAFNNIPIPVLTALAGATAGLVAFQKLGGFKVAGMVSRGLASSGGPGGVVSAITGGGVQKVYVVNLPPAGGIGGLGSDAANESKLARYGRIAGQAGLVAGIGYYGAKGVQSGVNNLAAAQSTGFSHGTVGSDRPRSAFSHIAPGAPSSYIDTNNLKQVEALLGRNGTAFDALRQRAGRASAQIDQIGPRAANSLSSAIGAVGALQSHLAALHDKKIQVIAQTQSAINNLERLQAMQIADKSFTVYQRNQIIERTVGPGGGMGRNTGLGPAGGSGGGASGGGAVGRTPVHIHLDDNGKRVLTGHMEDTADRVYQANRAYSDARYSR